MTFRARLALLASALTAVTPILVVGGAAPAAAATTIYVSNLQPSWVATGGGGVYSAYYGPPAYSAVSPGSTAVYDGRDAGVIKAGLTVDGGSGNFEDEGLFAFKPNVTIETFASGPLTYEVENQSGANPVWITIEIDTGVVGDRSDNTVYQYVPATNPVGWHTVDAGAATTWLQWTTPSSGITTGPPVSLADVATAHPGVDVVRTYLRLGIGNSYGIPVPTIGWVDEITIGADTYDFVAACTTTCYVSTTGSDTNSGSVPGDAFATIDHALDVVAVGGTVVLGAGTFTENVRVDKEVTLTGAGQLLTTIMPATSNPNPCAGSSLCGSATAASNVVLVEADNVTISDLTVDGDNPSLTSGVVAGGADLDARNGIITNHYLPLPLNNLEVADVTVRNIYLRGLYASTGGTFDVHDSTVTNVQADPSSIAMMNWKGSGSFTNNTVSDANDGIVSNHSSGTSYVGNVVTSSFSGIHTDNAGDYGGTPDLIQGNTVSGCPSGGYGVWVFVSYLPPVVDENTVSGCDVGLGAFGGAFDPAPTVTAVFRQNTVSHTGAPVGSIGFWIDTTTFYWGETDISVSATNNSISGFETGVQVIESGGQTATAVLADNSITGNTTGMPNTTTATPVDAEDNWWGSKFGPTNASNPPGAGQTVGTGVDFLPWRCSGTDTSAAPGFQPAATQCYGRVDIGADVELVEGNAGTQTVVIPISVTPAYPSGPLDVTWQTVAGTASGTGPARDFNGATGTVTIPGGSTSGSISVTVRGDTRLESYESFSVVLNGGNFGIGDGSATIKILNDELPAVRVTGTTITEGGPIKYTVKTKQQYYAPLTLSFSTADGTATVAAGDYTPVSALPVVIAAGTLGGNVVSVTSLLDGVAEATAETVKGVVTGGKAPATGTGKIRANAT